MFAQPRDQQVIAGAPPALIIAQSLDTGILTICDEETSTVLDAPTGRLGIRLPAHLFSRNVAQRVAMHGVFMDALGVGVLIIGDSGLGMSAPGINWSGTRMA